MTSVGIYLSFFCPSFCFLAFLVSASSMGAAFTKGISSLYFSGIYTFRASGPVMQLR